MGPLDFEGLLKLLNKLVVRLAALRNLDEILGAILDALLCVWPVDACGIYVMNPNTGALHLKDHRGLRPEFIHSSGYYGADSPNSRLVRLG